MPIEGFNLSPKMRTGFIPLDISLARIVSASGGESFASSVAAGYISSASTPKLNALSTAVRVEQLQWSSGSAVQIQLPTVVLPPDFSSASAPTINLIAGRVSAASSDTSPAWTINVYTSTSASAAPVSVPVTNITSSVPTAYSAAISTVQMAVGYPNVLTVLINPASSQDVPILYGAWLEYTRVARG